LAKRGETFLLTALLSALNVWVVAGKQNSESNDFAKFSRVSLACPLNFKPERVHRSHKISGIDLRNQANKLCSFEKLDDRYCTWICFHRSKLAEF